MKLEMLRELLARREGPTLDFKRDQYDWNAEGNLELAKDLMAIANVLSHGIPVGHILIGVEEAQDHTGQLVGINPSLHLDDATLHEKVKFLLNRVPAFEYAPVEVDGKFVGVFEIRRAARPYYPLKSQGARHRLNRFEARVRSGSSTDVASPDQIQAWCREDDPDFFELRRVELELKESQLLVRSVVTTEEPTFVEDLKALRFAMLHKITIHNLGESRFTVARVLQTWLLTERFFDNMADSAPKRPTDKLTISTDVQPPIVVPPGGTNILTIALEAAQGGEYIHSQTGVLCSSSEWVTWFEGEATIECVGASGRKCMSPVAFPRESISRAHQANREAETAARLAKRAAERREQGPFKLPRP